VRRGRVDSSRYATLGENSVSWTSQTLLNRHSEIFKEGES